MSNLPLIAILVFILSIITLLFFGRKTLAKSARDAGGGNIIRSVVFLSAAITIVITLLLKYVALKGF
jgi:hypothetical protein